MGNRHLVPKRVIRLSADALWWVAVDRLNEVYKSASESDMRSNVLVALRAYNALKKLPQACRSLYSGTYLRDDVVLALNEWRQARKRARE